MNMSDLLLGVSLIVILALVGVIVYQSQRKAQGSRWNREDASTTDTLPASEPVDIHTPAPRLQPELGLVNADHAEFQRWDNLFTFQERKFYLMLKQLLGDGFQIFSKVRMSDIVKLKNEPKDKGRYINWILTRHIDFVICEADQQKPLFGIELDDSSHSYQDRIESDKFKDTVFAQVGLPLLRFKVKTYTKDEVENRIRAVLDNYSIPQPPK